MGISPSDYRWRETRRKARMRSKTRAEVAAAIAVLVLAGCGSAAPSGSSRATTGTSAAATVAPTPTELPRSFGYLGATVAQFKAAHGADSGPGIICTAVNACFGPPVVNSEAGATYEFVNVSVDGGIVSGYTMYFANGTTIADAKAEVLAWLPRDTTTTFYAIDHSNGSCVLWNLRGPTLARKLGIPKIGDPRGDLGVTLSYFNAKLNASVYDPNSIQYASVSVLPNSPTDSC
jgi:hypothetical protein